MHTGAAEDDQLSDTNQSVPIDDFDQQNPVFMRLYMNYLEKNGSDIGKMLIYIFELMCRKDHKMPDDVEYSKKFFTRYYFIDAATFNKWIKRYCPELHSKDFKKKRKFTYEEAKLIFEKLGTISSNQILPSTRKELFKEILPAPRGKKSKNYEAISVVFDERIREHKEFNKLPPIVIKQILFEETLEKKYGENNRDLKLEKEVLLLTQFFEYYFPKYTEKQWNIRKRWFRMLWNKAEPEVN